MDIAESDKANGLTTQLLRLSGCERKWCIFGGSKMREKVKAIEMFLLLLEKNPLSNLTW